MAKPKAVDRTVDMFTGRTKVDELAKPIEEAPEPEAFKGSETIEVAAERWRSNAMFTAEHFSKHFNENLPGTAKFRITQKGPHMFLEQFRLGKDGEAFHWSGVMFQESDLYELTSTFVRASKALQLVQKDGNLPGGTVSVMQGTMAAKEPGNESG